MIFLLSYIWKQFCFLVLSETAKCTTITRFHFKFSTRFFLTTNIRFHFKISKQFQHENSTGNDKNEYSASILNMSNSISDR